MSYEYMVLKAQYLLEKMDNNISEERERAACIRHQVEGHELSDRCKSLLNRNESPFAMKLEHNIDFPKIEGVKFFLVGGAVRDMVMGVRPKDEDFVMLTNYNYEQVIDQLNRSGVKIFQTKPEFQIIIMGIKDKNNPNKIRGVDLAFPRTEGKYSDGRRPDMTSRTNDLKEDAARRDFTINSMFMDEEGNVMDYFGGKDDLQNKIIRTVGNPDERFTEDALRILRAMRFSAKLGFSIDAETYASMQRNVHLLENPAIAIDRMRSEINNMLALNPDMGMRFLLDFKMNEILRKKDPKFKYEMVQSGIKQ